MEKCNDFALEVNDVSKQYGGVSVLSNVSIGFKKGEVHGLIGANGAGKSTLCKIISGAIQPSSGQIKVAGKTFEALTPQLSKKSGISMVYQELNLAAESSVSDNLFVGKEIRKGIFTNDVEMLRRSEELFETLGIKVDCKEKIKNLPLAICQLVEIGKALLEDSRILILDEPTAPLSNKEVDILFEVINKLTDQGITIIYISHRFEEVFKICERLSVLKDGKLIDTVSTSTVTKADVVKMMIGRELSQEFPEYTPNNKNAEEILRIENIENEFISNISFSLKKGEVLGLAGLVGAGRTEIARAIFGADPLREGKIYLENVDVSIKSSKDAIKYGIGLIPEDRKRQGLMTSLSIKLNSTITVIKNLSRNLVINKQKERKLINEYIKLLNIKLHNIENPISSLSGGNQQKVVLAKWLAAKCKVLILDEPTRGVDVAAKKEIYDLILELKSHGIGIILISSELAEILNLSDRILVMHNKAIVGELDHSEGSEEILLSKASGL